MLYSINQSHNIFLILEIQILYDQLGLIAKWIPNDD